MGCPYDDYGSQRTKTVMLMMPIMLIMLMMLMMLMIMTARWVWNPQTKKFVDEGIYMLHEHVNGDFTRFIFIFTQNIYLGLFKSCAN